ncbi:hypothetical protein WDU94_015073 [Cyamophila willieti]
MATSTPPPLDLDPKEVLAHLNYLGYHHITGHQLKDFMKDLKKLIRYDQVKSKENAAPVAPTSHYKRKACHRSLSSDKHTKINIASENTHISIFIFTESVSSTSNLTKISSSSNENLQQKPLRPIQSKAKPCSASTMSSAPTFIRPWQMRSSSQIHKAGTSSDPVALYQHYKELWKLQPLPGENNRSELRWQIREKMLACHPPPRVSFFLLSLL